MQEELISVIIPVYNVEDYLERCLKTVLAQTYENLEILLIDDGSTDGSGRICDEASEKDTRIRVWHTENQGPSAARNLGLDHVQGQYLLFADGDDILSVEYVSFLYEQLQKSKADIAVCRYVATKDGAFEETNGTKQLVWFGKEALENLLYQKYYTTGPVCKLFCREVFDGIRFPLGTLYEDTLAIAMAMGKARQVVYSDAIKYGYYQRAGSTMRSTYQEETWQYIEITEQLMEYIMNTYPELQRAAVSRFVWANLFVWIKMPAGKYHEKEQQIRMNLKKYRGQVLRDRQARGYNKGVILLSYFGQRVLQTVYHLKG